jgi:CrcB protein
LKEPDVTRLVLLFLGSGFGGVMRYVMATRVQAAVGGNFPIGTVAVNLVGCGAIGFLLTVLTGRFAIPEHYRLAIIAGVLGGFTTFSAFSMETYQLLVAGQAGRAIANVAVSVVGGLLAVWVGHRAGEAIL